MTPDLYDLKFVSIFAWWEPYILHDVSWVGSVLYRSCAECHTDKLWYTWSRAILLWVRRVIDRFGLKSLNHSPQSTLRRGMYQLIVLVWQHGGYCIGRFDVITLLRTVSYMLWRVLARFFILDFAQSWDTMYDYLFVSYTACVTRSVEYQERTT